MRRAVLGLAAGLMAAVAGWSVWQRATIPRHDLPPPPAISAGVVASLYDIALPDTAGRTQSLAQWRGKVLVVNYWATWCAPCREEMPLFSKLAADHAARGVQFVGIAADGADKVRDHARRNPVAYPLLIGGEAAIDATLAFGNVPKAVPFTIVLDRAGGVRTAMLGRVDEAALARLLDGLARGG